MFGNVRNVIKYDYQIMKGISRNKNSSTNSIPWFGREFYKQKVSEVSKKEFKYKPPDNKLPHKDFIKIFRWQNY